MVVTSAVVWVAVEVAGKKRSPFRCTATLFTPYSPTLLTSSPAKERARASTSAVKMVY